MIERDQLDVAAPGAWEVTTAGGSRILLDLDRRQWMRLPAFRADGTLNLAPSDGCWQRLASVYALLPGEQKAPPRVGERMRVHIGMSDWWTTTAVVAIRGPLAATEVPAECLAPECQTPRPEKGQ